MAWVLHLSPKNAANSRAISFIFMKNLSNYAHFYLVIGLSETLSQQMVRQQPSVRR